jgi:heme-degrading monooxygenase HmoA
MTTDPSSTVPSSTAQSVFEIALYRVHDGDAFAARHHELHREVRRFNGFVRAEALRSQEQPDVFADVVEWSDLSDAAVAATQFTDTAVAQWFGTQCAEMIFFGHLERNPLVPSAGEVPTS